MITIFYFDFLCDFYIIVFSTNYTMYIDKMLNLNISFIKIWCAFGGVYLAFYKQQCVRKS